MLQPLKQPVEMNFIGKHQDDAYADQGIIHLHIVHIIQVRVMLESPKVFGTEGMYQGEVMVSYTAAAKRW